MNRWDVKTGPRPAHAPTFHPIPEASLRIRVPITERSVLRRPANPEGTGCRKDALCAMKILSSFESVADNRCRSVVEAYSPSANSMTIRRLVGAGIFVFGQPPNNHGGTETKRQSDWHGENAPKFIHNRHQDAGWSWACKASLPWTNLFELTALQPTRAPGGADK